jgi:A/G-specific adenine glycosylase
VYRHFKKHERTFPWRETTDPYRILVSEIMLQQTQTDRVLQKYDQFIALFPDFRSLAEAHLQDILQAWIGLGYNRRALSLKKIAQIVINEFDGVLPSSAKELLALPGIGKYSAEAIRAFAFNQPTSFVETNIRTVYIFFFFNRRNDVKDRDILRLVEETVDTTKPRQWYHALFDYGAMLKRHNGPVHKVSRPKQSRFQGSDRQIRGAILKALLNESPIPNNRLILQLGSDPKRITRILDQMANEGFITIDRDNATIFLQQ